MKTMANALGLLTVLPALGLPGCVSDFSPDPLKTPDDLGVADAGTAVASRDAGSTPKRDAATGTPTDTGSTAPRNEGATTTPNAKKDAGASPPDDGSPASAGNPAGSPCDLTGRWIMTERALSSAFGAKQINILWHYLELTQQGANVTMKKTLLCGGSTVGEPGGFAVMMDDSQAWPAYQEKTNYNGRKGTAEDSGGGCAVAFEEAVLIRGMTPEYKDTKVALPTLEEKASGGKGWEDWDGDGKPGVTMNVSGAATGKVFTSFRTSGNCSGAIAANAKGFQLDNYDWVTERAVLGTDPGDPITRSLLASPAERAPDKGKNFVEFARLAGDQATGDDSAVCEAIRSLAPTLNATANKI
jgi:hypothetical protein